MTGQNIHILIVEDEPSIADNVSIALQLDGFTSEHFILAQEGLNALQNSRFDLAIIDVGLPDFNGFELCKRIREFSNIPIIFLTARSDEIDRILGLELGADDYVTKPFSPRELSTRVKAILRRVAPSASTERSDTLILDQKRACIFYREQKLPLTRIEYLLLSKMLNNPEQVFSREQLMQAAWDHPEHSLDRAVDTHIKTIRAKLNEFNPDQQLIKTHRGLGYSLVLDE
ncbi:two-component system regulatory protein [Neptuniibacter caesariensis]|uniref:Two-component system regulatory protein n=1 Tax=Neptuniibacter caesariensis TaxID=207954 RepID=A0A7U8C2K6_NEPCE|nr:two-component system regulatory protein [Neptuniibacter caesariensis]